MDLGRIAEKGAGLLGQAGGEVIGGIAIDHQQAARRGGKAGGKLDGGRCGHESNPWSFCIRNTPLTA